MTHTIPPFDEVLRTSEPRPPFSNGHEGEEWMTAWCGRCKHDGDCTLVDVAATRGHTPLLWVELDPASLRNRYICLGWSPSQEVTAL